MLIFSRISVGLKILVLMLLPLSGLLFFATKQVVHDIRVVSQIKNLGAFRNQIGIMNQHALQERIATTIFLNNPDDSGQALRSLHLKAQGDEEALVSFLRTFSDESLGTEFDQNLQIYRQKINDLARIRQNVLARTASKLETLEFYSAISKIPADMVAAAATAVDDFAIAKSTSCYAALMHYVESSAQANQIMMDALLMNSFDQGELKTLSISLGNQAYFAKQFLMAAPEAIGTSFRSIQDLPSFKQIVQHCDTSIEKAEQGPAEVETWMAGIDDLTWPVLIAEKRERVKLVLDDIGQALDEKEKKLEHRVWLESFALVGYFILVCLLAMTIRGYLVRSINTCLGFNNQIAEGDLSQQLVFNQRDEVGSLMGNMNRMVDKLTGMIREIIRQAGDVNSFADKVTISSIDLREQLESFFEGTKTVSEAVARLNGQGSALHHGESSLPELFTLTESVKTNIDTVERAASEMSHEIQRSSVATRQMTAQTSNLAGATEEMSASLEEIRRSTEQSAQITSEVVACTTKGINDVTELDQLTHKVEEVTRIVSSLAAQTHLLALNASIEAANAGKAGVGFAVVAEEVKVLAEKSRLAAESISERIQDMRNKSGQTIKVIRNMGGLIEQLDSANQMIASAVTQQSIAMKEISAGVEGFANNAGEINCNLEMAASNAEKVANQVEEASAGVASIVDGVEHIKKQTQQVHQIMEENGARMIVCANEVSQTGSNAKGMSSIARQLTETVAIFKIQAPA